MFYYYLLHIVGFIISISPLKISEAISRPTITRYTVALI